MRLQYGFNGWYDHDERSLVALVISRKAVNEVNDPTTGDNFAAIRVYVNQVLNEAYEMGKRGTLHSSASPLPAAPSFPSMVALQIEKIKAAKQIVRSMDGIKEACVQRGRGVEFREEMASAYETALKFLEGQLKEDISVEVNIEVTECHKRQPDWM